MSQHAYSHDSAGRRNGVTRENGEAWSYTYNDRGELTSGAKANGAGVKPGHTFGYAYDGIGNRVSTSEDTPTGLAALLWGTDETNALVSREHATSRWVQGRANPATEVKVNGVLATRETTGEFRHGISASTTPGASWDPLMIQGKLAGAGANGSDLVIQRQGHLWFSASPESFTYDADGNLTSDGRWDYTWDAENRLIGMQTNTVTATAVSASACRRSAAACSQRHRTFEVDPIVRPELGIVKR